MNIWIIVALYWIVCCVLVYVLAHINGQVAYRRMMKQKTTFWEHLLIVLFSPLAAPIMLFATAYHGCINLYYRNRPRPLPKKMKKYMKKDCVLDENNQTVSLAEYNYRHATEYTLDDVYGKGYVESLTEKERASIATEFKEQCEPEEVQESISDIPEVRRIMVVRRFALWVLSWILKIFPTQMLSMQRDSDTQWQRDIL